MFKFKAHESTKIRFFEKLARGALPPPE